MTIDSTDSTGPERHNRKERDASRSNSWLRSLDEIGGADLPLVGGKAFRLAKLKQHGLKVPPGLVLTTAFFETQLQHAHLTPLWVGSPDIAVTVESLGWLASSLKTKPLAKKLAEALNQRMDYIFDREIDSFAVRSSAIDEDQRSHTFAGVHLTELGVPRSALTIAITRCWASALDGPALQYRQVHGMSIQGIRVAILIQPMLQPKVSGVGFTVNPLTNSRDELIIEATWGLGESLVKGEVQPYSYKLLNQPPDYPVVEQRPGNTTPPLVEVEPAPPEPLGPEVLTDLAHQLEQIQALMGEPQDVEWVYQNDAFFFLQTRPVPRASELPPTLDYEWTRGSHPEFLPELPSPLFGSLLERTQHRAITFFKEGHLEVDKLGPYVKLILGRPYLNLSFLKRIISQAGLNPGNLLYTIGHTEPGAVGGALSVNWSAAWKARRTYGFFLKRILSSSGFLKNYQALINEVTAILDDLTLAAPPTDLLIQLRQHERVYSELFNTNLGLAGGISAITALGSSLVAPLTRTPATLISALALQGLKTTDSDLNQTLLHLSQLARHEPQVQKYLAEAPQDFHNYPHHLPASEFKQSFDDLLAKHGQRGVYETDLGWPRYADDPAGLLRIIRQYLKSEPPTATGGAADPGHPAPVRPGASVTWDNLTDQPQGINRWLPWRRWLAAPFITLLRRFLAMRDELNSAKARGMAACRRWDLALGQKWVDQGWLAAPEDIFWLTLDEVERTIIIEHDVGITLSSIIQARKETYRVYAATQMPFSLPESKIPFIQLGIGLASETQSAVMIGLPISPGQTQGTVLVLHHPDEFEKVADEIILVTPSTDPAWLPLLHLASGLIVEMGGLLSHGSVIAREYGLPAVANIPNATQQFHTGDRVLVDGSTGIIQLLEAAVSAAPLDRD